MTKIKFDDEDLQKHFNDCLFRIECGGAHICTGICIPCMHAIESGQCSMLKEYFTKHNLTTAMSFRCKEKENE